MASSSSSSQTQKTSIVLNGLNDWDEWLGVIRMKANGADIWVYIDPATSEDDGPPVLEKPELPSPADIKGERAPLTVTSGATASLSTAVGTPGPSSQLSVTPATMVNTGPLTKEKEEDLKMRRYQYKQDMVTYQQQKSAMRSLLTTIQETISRTYLIYTLKCDTLYQMLRALKKRVAPTDRARLIELSHKYHKLQSIGRSQNLEMWLQQWERTYTEGQELGLPEVANQRPLYDFLQAVSDLEPGYSTFWRGEINKLLYKGKHHKLPDLFGLIEVFRNERRESFAKKGKTSHSAFSASFQGQSTDDKKEDGKEKKEDGKEKKEAKEKKCVCDERHKWKDCPYLIEGKRAQDWKPNEEIQKKITEKLEKNEWMRKAIDKVKGSAEKGKAGPKPASETPSISADPQPAAFVTSLLGRTFASASTFSSVYVASNSTYEYTLRHSFILDSGASVHVCNDRSQFRNIRAAEPEECLVAGSSIIQIEAFGSIDITLEGPSGPRIIELKDTALIVSFHTSVVSLNRFIAKNVHWNTEREALTYKGELFCKVKKRHDQWLLEYDPVVESVFTAQSALPRPDKEGSTDLWHRRLGHIGPAAVEHLPEAVIGVKLLRGPKTIECEVCSLSKAHQQISRRPTERVLKPYQKVHLDLIEFNRGYNEDRWAIHFLCDCILMNHVYTISQKSLALQTVMNFTAFVRRRYHVDVQIFRLDGETSLGRAFDEWVGEMGISVEKSAPRTPAQNGAAERSGGVMITKARAIRIDAHLPENLWPETIKAAGYLTNRAPTKRLDWKTPFQKLQEATGASNPKPNIAHLAVYGCRAYALNQQIPRRRKLEPRAFIGYLVGYESTNIFRIWIPEQKKVVATRDVTFDETKTYSPEDLTKKIQLQKNAELPLEVVNITPLSTSLAEDLHTDSSESELTDLEETESAIMTPSSHEPSLEEIIPIQQTVPQRLFQSEKSPQQETLPTPENTPDPTQAEPPEAPSSSLSRNPRPAPSQEVIGDIDPSNIIEGPRTRKPARRDAYLSDLATPESFPGYRAAFHAGVNFENQKLHRDQLPKPPQNWKQLLKHPHKDGFLAAAQKEYKDLNRRNTFQTVPKTKETKTLPVMWVFSYKYDTNGFLLKYKARICVRGDLQQTTHQDNYAATLAGRTFRALMAIMAAFDLEAFHHDAVNAFTNSPMEETVYCEPPEGFEQAGFCLLLLRALYGLRRSALLWWKEFSSTLKDLGFIQVGEDHCLFMNDWATVFFHVDDIVILCQTKDLFKYQQLRNQLHDRYEFRDLGVLKWFLGIRILRDREEKKLWLCQDSYVEKIVSTFHLQDVKPALTPMGGEELVPYEGKATPQEIYSYQRKVRSFLYAATITRADVAFTAAKLSEFLQNPSPQHQGAINRALTYLNGTKTLAIEYSKRSDKVFLGASDASFADDSVTRRSTEGYLFQLFGGCIDWRSIKQRTVTTSSTEAELLALSHGAKEVSWWKRCFKGITFEPGTDLSIQCDNQQTIRLLIQDTLRLVTKLRHVDIHNHWLRQEVQADRLRIEWVRTADMRADGLTKALPTQKHRKFVEDLGLVDVKDLLNGDTGTSST